ncbi:hypothetical protein CGCS363_v007041 [Colletotrichum siamense]|uniref:uncharacterized protein n=1 Tax=Colletotrichum siamense TaxID=690259 RepID=UPI001873072D|nr:uncharacterized protein CGCS363_v007041 [Colletotrichum siamense]KAF5500588.1 hypothetical protein CGCS363_v007041 [Colletotrichum siamense]
MAVDVSQLGADMATMHLNGLPIPHLPYEIFLQVVESLISIAISEATEHPLSLSIQEPDARDEIHGKHKILLGKHQFIRQADISHRLDLVRNFHQIDRKTRRMVASALVQLPITTFECGVTYIWMCPRVDAFQIIFPLSFLRSLRHSPALHLIEHVVVNPVEACFTMFPEIVEILTALPALKSVTLISYFGVDTNAHIPGNHPCQHENATVVDEKSLIKLPPGFELSGPSWAPIWERKVAFYLTGYYQNYLFRRNIQLFRYQDGADFGSKSSSDGSLLIRRLDPFS